MVYSKIDIFTTVVRATHGLKLVVGATHTPADILAVDILAAALTLFSRVHQRKVAVKPRKLKSLAGCYNYKGNELAQNSMK